MRFGRAVEKRKVFQEEVVHVWNYGIQNHLERWVNCRKGGMSGEHGVRGLWWQEARPYLMLRRLDFSW